MIYIVKLAWVERWRLKSIIYFSSILFSAASVAFLLSELFKLVLFVFTIKIIDRMILAPTLDKYQG
ncbi:hypothetical protein DVQ54_06900 [Yersinia enterocolitica]|nr:hypothetical protein [Yersinia enterocolitica]